MLSNCRFFTEVPRLHFRIRLNTGWLHHNDLNICGVEVQFGLIGESRFSEWRWSGHLQVGDASSGDGDPHNAFSHWVEMTKQ